MCAEGFWGSSALGRVFWQSFSKNVAKNYPIGSSFRCSVFFYSIFFRIASNFVTQHLDIICFGPSRWLICGSNKQKIAGLHDLRAIRSKVFLA